MKDAASYFSLSDQRIRPSLHIIDRSAATFARLRLRMSRHMCCRLRRTQLDPTSTAVFRRVVGRCRFDGIERLQVSLDPTPFRSQRCRRSGIQTVGAPIAVALYTFRYQLNLT